MKEHIMIRPAESQDIPAIVDLLKQSLGEVSSTKTEAYWRWKHVENPFGPSPVFIAEEAGQIIGVRAMMQWQWQKSTNVYKSLRAVDTATHPAHQGKGIFKRLTQHLIEQAKAEDYAFIFNTPNQQSLPGYLKMGWQRFTHAPVFIKPVIGFHRKISERWHFYQQQLKSLDPGEYFFNDLLNDRMHTPKSYAYVNWRYKECPFLDYGLVKDSSLDSSFGIIIKRKKRSRFYELRICDYWLKDAACFPELISAAVKAACETGCLFLSMCLTDDQQKSSFRKHGFISIAQRSPLITMRMLQKDPILTAVPTAEHWHFHTGDLELF